MNARPIAFSSCWGSSDFPVTTQHVEVGPVSRGVMLPCGSTPLPSITGGQVAFSTILCRPFPQGRLRFPYLPTTRRRNDRFTAFGVMHTTGSGPFYPPAAFCPCDRIGEPINPLHPVLGQATSTLGLSTLTRFIEGSHMLANTSQSRPKPPWCWQQLPILTDPAAPSGRDTLSRWLHTVPLPEPHATVDYRVGKPWFHSLLTEMEQCFTTLYASHPQSW